MTVPTVDPSLVTGGGSEIQHMRQKLQEKERDKLTSSSTDEIIESAPEPESVVNGTVDKVVYICEFSRQAFLTNIPHPFSAFSTKSKARNSSHRGYQSHRTERRY